MYYINNETTELTVGRITKIIQGFKSKELPRLQLYKDYYNGNQDINNKRVQDTTKPCNKLVCNYCYDIVENYNGYLTGIPIVYSSNEDISDILKVLNYNDVRTEDSNLLKNALIYGVAYELHYLDTEAQQRFKLLDSEQVIPIYTNDLEERLVAAIRFYTANDIDDSRKTFVDVYTDYSIKHYKSDYSFTTLELIAEEPHYYQQVPITVFNLNTDNVSVFAQIMSLQDAYNKIVSAEVDDFEAFVDAYMVLKGVNANSEDIAAMKENRILLLEEDSTVEYLTKQGDVVVINSLLDRLNTQIQKISKSPDFTDEKLMSQSGIAIQYKLVGMENNASNMVANMKQALLKRLELICAIQSLTLDEMTWRDIKINFTRNLPVNETERAQYLNQLRGLVSDKTLLSQIPFITDVDAEIEQKTDEAPSSVFNFEDEE